MITEMTIAERNTGTATLMRALEACHKSGEVITVQSPFEDGPTRLVDVPVIDIDVAAQKFQVKRVGDDIGKWFAIRHIQSITLLSGETLASADGEAYWRRSKAAVAGRPSGITNWRSHITSQTSQRRLTASGRN